MDRYPCLEHRSGHGTTYAVTESCMGPKDTGLLEPPASIGSELVQLLQSDVHDVSQLDKSLRQLVELHGEKTYSDFLYLLAHLRYTPEEARSHWRCILSVHRSMEEQMAAPLDVRVSLVRYFVDVCHDLENPTVVELKLFQQTTESAYRDALTGLYNYRFFKEHVQREVARCERYSTEFSLIMLDLDSFKLFNDHNGHQAGNEALAQLGNILLETVRDSDVAMRYGGEEFAVVLTATSKKRAVEVADRIREKIEQHIFDGEERLPSGCLTASLGVASYPADANSYEELVARADQSLYVAKSAGKNRVVVNGKCQRTHTRKQTMAEGSFGVLEPAHHSFTTLNISEGGLLFETDRPVSSDSLVEVKLDLPDEDEELTLAARVIRVGETDGPQQRVAIRFVELASEHRKKLANYLSSL